MAFTGSVEARFTLNDTRAVGLNPSANIGINRSYQTQFSDGTGARQAKGCYHARRPLAAASEDLDLTGALVDAYGTALLQAEIKGLFIWNDSATATLTLGAAASNAWAALLGATGAIVLRPKSGFMVWTEDAAGWAVVAGTGDLLKVAGTVGQAYEVILFGNDPAS